MSARGTRRFHRRLRLRRDRGAIAVIVAASCVALFAVAAVSIDLGNAYARTRAVQSQADLAALSGGAALPGTKTATDPAVVAVAKYLNRNQPTSDGQACAGTETCVTAAQLVDGQDANGEVYFPKSTKMRVVTPGAHVSFGLARVVGGRDVDVSGSATVELKSPGPLSPFMLPEQCNTGLISLKDSSSDPKVGTFDPASVTGGSVATVNSVSPLTVTGGTTTVMTLSGKNYGTTLKADFFQEATGDRIPADVTASVPATKGADVGGDNTATVSLPAGVYNRPGTWYVRINSGGGTDWSKSYGTFVVGDPTPPPAGCGVNSTGDFGVLDSPRKSGAGLSDATALNIAKGLDHMLVTFPYPTYPYPTGTKDTCNGNGGTVPPGAVNDTNASVNDANCVNIKTGMNVPAVTAGYITGGSTTEGTFTGSLARPTSSGCDRNGGSNQAVKAGVNVNDDVLSCFLTGSVKVGDVSSGTIPGSAVGSISSAIFRSPRFAVVPVIRQSVNPQNGFYPIKSWQPVFITDESAASKKGESYATSENGLVVRSGNLVGVKVIPINPAALPETTDTATTMIDYLGSGTKVVTLVD